VREQRAESGSDRCPDRAADCRTQSGAETATDERSDDLGFLVRRLSVVAHVDSDLG